MRSASSVVTNDGGACERFNNSADLDIAGIIQLSGGDVVVTNDGSIAVSGVVETQDAVHLAASTSIAEIGVGRIAAESLTPKAPKAPACSVTTLSPASQRMTAGPRPSNCATSPINW